MRTIGYNTQRDNYDFAGKFKAFWQCFSTSVWMFMSFFTNRINAKDDKGLANYLDDVELLVGETGIAEKTIAKLKLKITGGSSYWWLIQKAGLEQWLGDAGVRGQCVFHDGTFPIYSLPSILKSGPVILATNKLGGLKGGHIILVVDYDEKNKSLICNDPFGNARTNYASPNGANVAYNIDWIRPYITIKTERCRCMYWTI